MTYTIPNNPTTYDLNVSLITLSNNMARLSNLIAQYKADVATKTTANKRALARAYVTNKDAKNATLSKALAEIDDLVIKTADDLDKATNLYILALGKQEGYEAQFTAVRKLVEIIKLEQMGAGQ